MSFLVNRKRTLRVQVKPAGYGESYFFCGVHIEKLPSVVGVIAGPLEPCRQVLIVKSLSEELWIPPYRRSAFTKQHYGNRTHHRVDVRL